ncbi:MAG TPA: hypothetical protein VGI66_00440, partial [Streptosporangiaceae bacterium]
IIAGAARTLLVVVAAGYGLPAAIAAAARSGPIPLTPLPTRICRPIIVFTAFGRRGLIGLVLGAGRTGAVRSRHLHRQRPLATII